MNALDQYDIDSAGLIAFANAWARLGTAITDQVTRVLDDPDNADVNENAIWEAVDALKSDAPESIVGPLREWLGKE